MSTATPTLPTAKDAEVQVIGSLLLDPSLIGDVTKTLGARAFVDPCHRAAYRLLTELDRADSPISPVIVRQKLKGNSAFVGETTPLVYVAEVSVAVATTAHLCYHARLVAEAGRKRRLYEFASTAAEHARNGRASSEVIADLWSDVEDFQREVEFGRDLLNEIHDARSLLGDGEPTKYLISGAIPAGEFGVESAKPKSLKSKTALDAAVAIATGLPFLKNWEVPRPARVGFISREIRGNVLDSWVDDIVASHGASRADLGNLFLDDQLPVDLTDDKWLTVMRRMIERFDLQCLMLDPANLLLPGVDVNSLTDMTKHLGRVKKISDDTGATVLMIHHNRKNARDPRQQFGLPTLEDIHGSGFHNVVRFWLLLNRRRDWEEESRKHWLWLVMGGSSGHASCKCYIAEEGRSDSPAGTYWDVQITDPESQAVEDKADLRASAEAGQMEVDRTAVCRALAQHPEGLSRSRAKTLSAVSGRRWPDVVETMLEEGDIEPAKVFVSNHKTPRDGIKLATQEID